MRNVHVFLIRCVIILHSPVGLARHFSDAIFRLPFSQRILHHPHALLPKFDRSVAPVVQFYPPHRAATREELYVEMGDLGPYSGYLSQTCRIFSRTRPMCVPSCRLLKIASNYVCNPGNSLWWVYVIILQKYALWRRRHIFWYAKQLSRGADFVNYGRNRTNMLYCS